MAEENPITFDSLPVTNEVLSSDTILVLVKQDGSISPKFESLSAISEFFASEEDYAEIEAKVKTVLQTVKTVSNYLRNTFITKTDAKNNYSTIEYFDTIVSKIEKTKDFVSTLSKYATDEYLNRYYQTWNKDMNAKAQHYVTRIADKIEGFAKNQRIR